MSKEKENDPKFAVYNTNIHVHKFIEELTANAKELMCFTTVNSRK